MYDSNSKIPLYLLHLMHEDKLIFPERKKPFQCINKYLAKPLYLFEKIEPITLSKSSWEAFFFAEVENNQVKDQIYVETSVFFNRITIAPNEHLLEQDTLYYKTRLKSDLSTWKNDEHIEILLSTYSEIYNIPVNDLCFSIRGSNDFIGSFLHIDLVIMYLQWAHRFPEAYAFEMWKGENRIHPIF